MPRGKTAEVRRAEAHLYLDKAVQFAKAAQSELERKRYDSALLNAIHSAISSTDSVTTALLGRRSTDPDHYQAVDLLEEAAGSAPEIKAKSRQVRSLLGRKNLVEYESRPATARDAVDGVERAIRILEWARDVVRKARV